MQDIALGETKGSKTPDPLLPFIADPGTAGDTQTFDHTYAIGSGYEYCVTVDAETSEGFYPANTYVFTASSYTDPTNTISVETTTPDTGYNFALVFEDGGTGTSSESYTIDWGDGTATTSASAVPNESSATIDHNYANSGVYNITVTGDDSGDVGSYQSNFAVAPPTLTSAGEQVTGPGQPVTLASFTGLTDADANAEVDWGDGTGPHPGNILEDGTITADAPATPGVYTPTITLYQPDSGAGPGFVEYGGGLTSSVGVDTTVDVWGVKIDNGESNDLLIASSDGTQNLQPVTVYFPHPAGEALDLTLTSSDDTEDDVWDTETPSSGATPLLGNGVASASFTVSPTDPMEQTLWVGATQGDTATNVFSLSLSGSVDSAASTSTFNSEVAAGSFGATGATGCTGADDEASDGSVQIITNAANPNGAPAKGVNVSAGSQNVLVGQMVSLAVKIDAPGVDTSNAWYRWVVSGNVMSAYSPGSSGVASPVNDGELDEQAVTFFWVSTPAGSSAAQTQPVTLTVGNLGSAPVTIATDFSVYTPTPSFSVQLGWSGIHDDPNRLSKYLLGLEGLVFTPPAPAASKVKQLAGIIWTGQVTTPTPVGGPAFATGLWNYTQLLNDKSFSTNSKGVSKPSGLPTGNDYDLDTAFPYGSGNLIGLGNLAPVLIPYNKDKSWSTDSGIPVSSFDAPGVNLPTAGSAISAVSWYSQFHTYVMYMPPGPSSQWVPLVVDNWSAQATVVPRNIAGSIRGWILQRATYPNGKFTGNWEKNSNFVVATDEPEWPITVS